MTTEYLTVDGNAIAIRHRPGKTPGLVWLGGYRSDMIGTKAEMLDQWARDTGHMMTRHDYSGHGESGGKFADGTISRWVGESLAVFEAKTRGPQILIGSSMGAWVALRMAAELNKDGHGDRVAGMLLLAPAPDFTIELMEPLLTEEQKRDLNEKGYFEEVSEYSPEPDIFTRAFFEDGRENRVMDGIIETGCPVHIIQGKADPDVPFRHALKLVEHMPADDVTLTLVPDGDHRLSRPQDLTMIKDSIANLIAVIEKRTG